MKLMFSRDSWLWWAFFPAALVIFCIWYNFGFSLGAMLEEWSLLYLIQANPSYWNSFPGQLRSAVTAARPLDVLPFFLANYLSANSFVGLHLLLMLACALRMIGAAWLGHYLFRNRFLAATLGVLSFVYPSDTQQFEFRTMHISMAVGMMVFAAALGVWALTQERSSQHARALALIGSIVFSCIGVLIYEPVAPLYAIAPLVIFAREGARGLAKLVRSRTILALIWLTAPIINLLYLYYTISIFKSSYQVNASNGSIGDSVTRNLHYIIDSASYRIFYDAWISVWDILVNQTAHYGFLIVTAAALAVGLGILAHRAKIDTTIPKVRYIFVGGLLSVAGYVPFMVAQTHMEITQRTFMGTSFGSALIMVTLLAWLYMCTPMLSIVSAAFVLFLGLVSQVYQFDRYNRDYVDVVLPYTSMLADKADPSKKVHLVIDRTGFGGHLNGMHASKVEHAPIVRGRLKNTEFVFCMDGPLTPYLTFSECSLRDGKWAVNSVDGQKREFAQDIVQVIEIGPEFDPAYRSHSGIWHDYGSFSRENSIFVNTSSDAYHCVADGMWGYSGYCRGRGWSDGIFDHTYFHHKTFTAALVNDPTLLVPLSPKNGTYLLRIGLHDEVDAEIASKMEIKVNGQLLNLLKKNNLVFEAEVPEQALKEGLNEIAFNNASPSGAITGLRVSRFDLTPLQEHLTSTVSTTQKR